MTFNNDSSKFMKKKKSLKESLVVIACKILINKLSKGILTVVRRALLHLVV